MAQFNRINEEHIIEQRNMEALSNISSDTSESVIGITSLLTDKLEVQRESDKIEFGRIVFAFPIIIFLVGIIAFFVLSPDNYNGKILFIDMMFSAPENIIDIIFNTNIIIAENESIIGVQLFLRIWLVSLIISLFFVGKRLHKKMKPNITDTILIKKEPYLMIQEVSNLIKQIKNKKNDKELDTFIYSVKCLEERLSIESDFGYGNSAVINCENDIARQLQFLLARISNLETEDFIENIDELNIVVLNINALLRKRIELKKC